MINDLRRSPCYDCAGRHIGCHADCKAYGEFRKRLDEINKEKEKETALNHLDTLRKLNAWQNEQRAYQRRKAGKKNGYSNRDSG